MKECTVCGAGVVRDDHADWCERVTTWLASSPPTPVLGTCRGNNTSYNRGCRCADCRQASLVSQRKYHARLKAKASR